MKQQSTWNYPPGQQYRDRKSATHSMGIASAKSAVACPFPRHLWPQGRATRIGASTASEKNAQLWRLHQCWFIEAVRCGDALRTNLSVLSHYALLLGAIVSSSRDFESIYHDSWCISSVGPLIYLYISSASKPALAGCTECAVRRLPKARCGNGILMFFLFCLLTHQVLECKVAV